MLLHSACCCCCCPRRPDSGIRLYLFQCAAIMALIIRAQIQFRPDISDTQALVSSAISLAYAGQYPESIPLSPINPTPLEIHTHTCTHHRIYKHLCPPQYSSVLSQPTTTKHKEHGRQINTVNNAVVITDLGLFFGACKLKNSSW